MGQNIAKSTIIISMNLQIFNAKKAHLHVIHVAGHGSAVSLNPLKYKLKKNCTMCYTGCTCTVLYTYMLYLGPIIATNA